MSDPALCRVEPLDPRAHAAALFEALHGPGNAALWRHVREDPAKTIPELVARLTQWTAVTHVRAHVFRTAAGEVAGMGARLRRQIADHPSLVPGIYEEIAAVVLNARHHGTGLAEPAVQHLISLTWGNEVMKGCLWRCSTENIASDRFARKLGFQHYATSPDGMAKGKPRNSHFYVLERSSA